MKPPSWKNAVFNAVNAFSSPRAYRVRCFWMRAEGSCLSAAANPDTMTPFGSGPGEEEEEADEEDERAGSKWPFTKTNRAAGKRPKVISETACGSSPLCDGSNIGLKGSFAIGAMFVKRQSSSRTVGKPISANRAMPALRNGKTHEGCLASRSKRSNCSNRASLSFIYIGFK